MTKLTTLTKTQIRSSSNLAEAMAQVVEQSLLDLMINGFPQKAPVHTFNQCSTYI